MLSVELVLDARSATLRRRVGANAWLVLEELVMAGTLDAAGADLSVVRVTVRDLARLTGLSKDTVARALQKLRLAAVVSAEPERQDLSGRFLTVRYRIDLGRMPFTVRPACTPIHHPLVPTAPTLVPPPPPTSRPTPTTPARSAVPPRAAISRRTPTAEQLDLLG